MRKTTDFPPKARLSENQLRVFFKLRNSKEHNSSQTGLKRLQQQTHTHKEKEISTLLPFQENNKFVKSKQ